MCGGCGTAHEVQFREVQENEEAAALLGLGRRVRSAKDRSAKLKEMADARAAAAADAVRVGPELLRVCLTELMRASVQALVAAPEAVLGGGAVLDARSFESACEAAWSFAASRWRPASSFACAAGRDVLPVSHARHRARAKRQRDGSAGNPSGAPFAQDDGAASDASNGSSGKSSAGPWARSSQRDLGSSDDSDGDARARPGMAAPALAMAPRVVLAALALGLRAAGAPAAEAAVCRAAWRGHLPWGASAWLCLPVRLRSVAPMCARAVSGAALPRPRTLARLVRRLAAVGGRPTPPLALAAAASAAASSVVHAAAAACPAGPGAPTGRGHARRSVAARAAAAAKTAVRLAQATARASAATAVAESPRLPTGPASRSQHRSSSSSSSSSTGAAPPLQAEPSKGPMCTGEGGLPRGGVAQASWLDSDVAAAACGLVALLADVAGREQRGADPTPAGSASAPAAAADVATGAPGAAQAPGLDQDRDRMLGSAASRLGGGEPGLSPMAELVSTILPKGHWARLPAGHRAVLRAAAGMEATAAARTERRASLLFAPALDDFGEGGRGGEGGAPGGGGAVGRSESWSPAGQGPGPGAAQPVPWALESWALQPVGAKSATRRLVPEGSLLDVRSAQDALLRWAVTPARGAEGFATQCGTVPPEDERAGADAARACLALLGGMDGAQRFSAATCRRCQALLRASVGLKAGLEAACEAAWASERRVLASASAVLTRAASLARPHATRRNGVPADSAEAVASMCVWHRGLAH